MAGQMNNGARKKNAARRKAAKNKVPVPPKKRQPLPTPKSPLKQFKNGTKRKKA